MRSPRFVAWGSLLALLACQSPAPPAAPILEASAHESADVRVRAIADAVVAELFTTRPNQVATLRPPGARYDALPDDSLAGVAARRDGNAARAAELRAIDRTALASEEARVAHDLASAWSENQVALGACRPELWRVSQMGGWQVSFADMAAAQPVGTPELRAQALARYARVPAYADAQIAALRAGLAEGWSAPRIVVDHVVRQLGTLIGAAPETSPYASPAMRDGDPAFRERFLALVRDEVNPALRRYRDFLETEYAPRARATIAASATPGGVACYRAALASLTTLDLAPEEIHARGLAGLEATQREMSAISARSFGGAPVRDVLERLRSAPEYRYRDEAHVLAHARAAMERAWAALPRAFSALPRARADLEPIPAYQARTAAAHYLGAALDGSRLGTYRVRTVEPTGQSWANGESVAYHEIVPGHHLQVALANENASVPAIARFLGWSGFSEGWALYAEQLADELGLYTSDVDRMGMLSSRSFRAARMVVDTGLHALGWERERAVEFMLAHTAMSRMQVEQEIDRYVAWPGQAPSYFLGYQEIVALRADAQQRLGERFDLHAFHDVVIGRGSATLPMLRARLETWVRDAERRMALAPRVDVRRADGAADACAKDADAAAYRDALQAETERAWEMDPLLSHGGRVVVPVAFEAEGLRALAAPDHSNARVVASLGRALEAAASQRPPACLRGVRGEITFVVAWTSDRAPVPADGLPSPSAELRTHEDADRPLGD
jgi:uncharacterized protein (DUF885 family)